MLDEPLAAEILDAAIIERRAAELIDCLFEGGTATVDDLTGRLVLVDGAMVKGLWWLAHEDGDDG